jgi:hypothetical protein
MATDAELMHQELEPLAIGETADQLIVGTFSVDYAATAFKFTLTSKAGRDPALVLTTAGGGLSVATVPDGSNFRTTVTVHYERTGSALENTSDLLAGDYVWDLWDTTNDARVAAGIQPVVTPSRKEA